MDGTTILQSLSRETSLPQQEQGLISLRLSLKENGGRLLIANLKRLFDSIGECLSAPNPAASAVKLQSLGFLADIAPEFEAEFGTYIRGLLPKVIKELGNFQKSVREAAYSVLSACITHTSNPGSILAPIIEYGVQHDEPEVRIQSLQTICALVKIENVSSVAIDKKKVLEQMVDRLRDVNEAVIRRAQECIGNVLQQWKPSFSTANSILNMTLVKELNPTAQQLLSSHLPAIQRGFGSNTASTSALSLNATLDRANTLSMSRMQTMSQVASGMNPALNGTGVRPGSTTGTFLATTPTSLNLTNPFLSSTNALVSSTTSPSFAPFSPHSFSRPNTFSLLNSSNSTPSPPASTQAHYLNSSGSYSLGSPNHVQSSSLLTRPITTPTVGTLGAGSTSVSWSNTLSVTPTLPVELQYGFIPRTVIGTLDLTINPMANFRERIAAIEEIYRLAQEMPEDSGNSAASLPVVPFMEPLLRFLLFLVDDNNFKIALTALNVIGTLVNKVGASNIRPHVATLLPRLIEKLSDNKVVIRSTTSQIIGQILVQHIEYMASSSAARNRTEQKSQLSASSLMNTLLSSVSHPQGYVREQVLNIMLLALLTKQSFRKRSMSQENALGTSTPPHDEFDFNYSFIAQALLSMLADPDPTVYRLVIEVFSVLHEIMGSELRVLIKQSCTVPTHLAALQERFFHRPPTLNRSNNSVTMAPFFLRQLSLSDSIGTSGQSTPIPASPSRTSTISKFESSSRRNTEEFLVLTRSTTMESSAGSTATSTGGTNTLMNASNSSGNFFASLSKRLQATATVGVPNNAILMPSNGHQALVSATSGESYAQVHESDTNQAYIPSAFSTLNRRPRSASKTAAAALDTTNSVTFDTLASPSAIPEPIPHNLAIGPGSPHQQGFRSSFPGNSTGAIKAVYTPKAVAPVPVESSPILQSVNRIPNTQPSMELTAAKVANVGTAVPFSASAAKTQLHRHVSDEDDLYGDDFDDEDDLGFKSFSKLNCSASRTNARAVADSKEVVRAPASNSQQLAQAAKSVEVVASQPVIERSPMFPLPAGKTIPTVPPLALNTTKSDLASPSTTDLTATGNLTNHGTGSASERERNAAIFGPDGPMSSKLKLLKKSSKDRAYSAHHNRLHSASALDSPGDFLGEGADNTAHSTSHNRSASEIPIPSPRQNNGLLSTVCRETSDQSSPISLNAASGANQTTNALTSLRQRRGFFKNLRQDSISSNANSGSQVSGASLEDFGGHNSLLLSPALDKSQSIYHSEPHSAQESGGLDEVEVSSSSASFSPGPNGFARTRDRNASIRLRSPRSPMTPVSLGGSASPQLSVYSDVGNNGFALDQPHSPKPITGGMSNTLDSASATANSGGTYTFATGPRQNTSQSRRTLGRKSPSLTTFTVEAVSIPAHATAVTMSASPHVRSTVRPNPISAPGKGSLEALGADHYANPASPHPRSPNSVNSRDREPLTPSMGSSDAGYLLTEEMQPLDDPDQELKNALRDIKSADWSERFNALSGLRRLTVCHAEVMKSAVKPLLPAICKEVDSLRSSLARNALMCLREMFQFLKKLMDAELDKLVPLMLKRASEAGTGFLSGEASKAMIAMVENCTESRSLLALMSSVGQKSVPIKTKCSQFIALTVEVMGVRVTQFKDYDRLIQTVGALLGEGAMEVRTAGKMAMVRLAVLNSDYADSYLQKGYVPCGPISISPQFEEFLLTRLTQLQYKAVRKVIDRGIDTPNELVSMHELVLPASAETAAVANGTAAASPGRSPSFNANALAVVAGAAMRGMGRKRMASAFQPRLAPPGSGDAVELNSPLSAGMANVRENVIAGRRRGGSAIVPGVSELEYYGEESSGGALGMTSSNNSTATGMAGTSSLKRSSRRFSSRTKNLRVAIQEPLETNYYDTHEMTNGDDLEAGESTANTSRSTSFMKPRRTQTASTNAGGSTVSLPMPEELPAILTELGSKDWQARLNSLGTLLDLIMRQSIAIRSRDTTMKIFDELIPRLSDGNLKVNVAALEILLQAIPFFEASLGFVVSNLVPVLANNCAARNPKVKELSRQALETLVSSVDAVQLIETFSNATLYGNAGVKPTMLSLLIPISETAYHLKSALVSKHVLPLVLAHLDDRRADVKDANRQLIQVLYGCMGRDLLTHASVTRLPTNSLREIYAVCGVQGSL